jgi:nickel-dependent lactate racemase
LAQFSLGFGSTFLEFKINSARILGILQPKSVPQHSSPENIVSKALRNQVASGIVEKLFPSGVKTLIVVPDKTRRCGAAVFLPILIDYLKQAGIQDADIEIILATGSHVGHTVAQREKIIGKELFRRIAVCDHDCRDDENLTYLGETKFGTPVYINRNLVNGRKVIVTGTAGHHYFAGFGGGPKMINPGCAGYETVRRNHALTINSQTGWLHPQCRGGVLEGNPVQEDIRDSLRFLRADFLFETVLNDRGEIVAAFAGDLLEAHQKACNLVDTLYKVPISEPADLVVMSCGGYPKDINFIQAHKSLHNAFYAVKPDGVILVLAECREGIGSSTFLEWFNFDNDDEFRDNLKRNYQLNGTTALALKMKTHTTRVILVSNLPDELVKKLGMHPASNLREGWKLAQSMLPKNFSCYVVPNASLTLPFVKE